MRGLYAIDKAVLQWINQSWQNPWFDWLMPLLSGNRFFVPLLILVLAGLLWKGGQRGRLCVLMLVFVVALGDGWICNTLKHLIDRPRPFVDLPVRLLVGRSGSGSLPSAHAANWFSALVVMVWFYRRSGWIMLPLALGVSLSRVYNGAHYPSDILAGAILGMGYAGAIMWGVNMAWRGVGQRWFPLWHEQMPSLLVGDAKPSFSRPETREADAEEKRRLADRQWMRLGYVLIGILLVARWVYIASDTIELGEDEAYQWTWSKHLALSYYSKPPLIAYTQRLGTSIWGDTAFGVRFFSPLISPGLALLVMRFMARQAGARAGFLTIPIASTAPLLGVGSILMTIDPLSVLFWTLSMFSGWLAVQRRDLRPWIWTGIWLGLGFLSKYTALFQILCWAVFFALWKPARTSLRQPGPYVALLILGIFSLPVLIWNAEHGWITVHHVASDGGMGSTWKPTLRYMGEFIGSELGLLNPIYFVAAGWASIAFWRRYRQDCLLIYLFSMGAPTFLVYWLLAFRSRVLPNWIVPSVIPLFCLMVIFWDRRWREGVYAVKRWLLAGLILGALVVVVMHDTDILAKITGRYLPGRQDPLHRVRGWEETARRVDVARQALMAEGKPVFIICDHYGLVGQISFYLPEAKTNLANQPLVYFQSSPQPINQYYFWPGYGERHGENAIYVMWADAESEAPWNIRQEFASVTSLGLRDIPSADRLYRRLQFFACRGLR